MVKVLLAGQEPLSGSDQALITRYVRIGRRPTSFRLEAATWNLLCAIAHRQTSPSTKCAATLPKSPPKTPTLPPRSGFLCSATSFASRPRLTSCPRNSGS